MGEVRLTKAPAYRWWVLIMNMIAYGSFFMTIQATAAFGPAIQEDMGLSAFNLSLYTMAIMLSFALFAGLGGKLQTRLGPKKVVLLGIVINVVASIIFAFVGNIFIVGIILRFIQGICGGFMAASIVSGTALWFPVRQRGLESGLLLGILGIGFMAATLGASIFLGAGIPWYTGLGMMVVIVSVVVFVLYVFTMKDISTMYDGALSIQELLPQEEVESESAKPVEPKPEVMSSLRKSKKYWGCVIFVFINAFLTYGFGSFLNPLLSVDLGITSSLITTIISSTFFITIIASPLGGIISDNVFKGSRYQVLMIGAATTVITLVLLPFVGPIIIVVAILLVLAYASVSFVCGTFWATPSEVVAPKIAGEFTGELTLIGNSGGVLAAPILSLLLDVTGTAFSCVVVCVVLGAIAFVAAKLINQ